MSTRGKSKSNKAVERPPRVTPLHQKAPATTLEAKTMRVAIYASPNVAASTDEQSYQCSVLAHERGFSDLHTVVDAQGGDNIDRLLLKTIREEIRHGACDALIAYSPSVLSNDLHAVEIIRDECKRAKARLLFVRE